MGRLALKAWACAAAVSIASQASSDPLYLFEDPTPLYFSGSNARAVMTLWNDSVDFTYIGFFLKGKVNGQDQTTEVLSIFNPNAMPLPPEPYLLRCMFASTHFDHGTNVEVFCRVIEYGEITVEESPHRLISVRNHASLFGRSEWEAVSVSQGATVAKGFLTQMRHDVTDFHITEPWTVDDLFEGAKACTAFYANTHGQISGNDAVLIPDNPQSDDAFFAIDGVSAESARHAGMGYPLFWSDLPPFNTIDDPEGPGTPPCSIAFLDSCRVGLNSSFGASFTYPYKNWYSNPNLENQAVVAWKLVTPAAFARASSTAFWSALRQGLTVEQAASELAVAWELYLSSITGQEANPQHYSSYLNLFGDRYTRLNSVYSGDDSFQAPADWYRPF